MLPGAGVRKAARPKNDCVPLGGGAFRDAGTHGGSIAGPTPRRLRPRSCPLWKVRVPAAGVPTGRRRPAASTSRPRRAPGLSGVTGRPDTRRTVAVADQRQRTPMHAGARRHTDSPGRGRVLRVGRGGRGGGGPCSGDWPVAGRETRAGGVAPAGRWFDARCPQRRPHRAHEGQRISLGSRWPGKSASECQGIPFEGLRSDTGAPGSGRFGMNGSVSRVPGVYRQRRCRSGAGCGPHVARRV